MIDLSIMGLEQFEYSDFKELCNEIYRFVAKEEHANLFRIKNEFPSNEYPHIQVALDALIDNASLRNGSFGYIIGAPPEFKESSTESIEGPVKEPSPEDGNYVVIEDDRPLKRIDYVRKVDSNVSRLLTDPAFYNPACVVEKAIESMNKGTTKTILDLFFVKDEDLELLVKTYKSEAEKTLSNFMEDFPKDPLDVSLYNQYNISSNIFIYIFNRSVTYYRLFSAYKKPGLGDISERLFPVVNTDEISVHRFPNSDDLIDAGKRASIFMEAYSNLYGSTTLDYVSSLLALFNNISIKKTRIKTIFTQYFLRGFYEFPSESQWNDAFDYYIEAKGAVKFLSFDNIQSVLETLRNIDEMKYGMSVEKIFKVRESEFYGSFIENPDELESFIEKYTNYKIYRKRVLINGSLKDAIRDFVSDMQVYDTNRLIKLYARKCGGPSSLIEPIIKTLDMSLFVNEYPLTPEEKELISAKLADKEWISKDHARSIFSDLHDLEHKFTQINMHELGFTSLQDVYYRSNYPSFRECILRNEFVGDDIYVDDRQFKLKMECRAFLMEVESLERYLSWIPVSKYRYINLQSPRYREMAKILSAYKEIIIELCKKQFVTPYSLKNMKVGISEIDDDDYDIEFYDAMLLASKANHQTLSGYRFYFIPTDSTSFAPSAPEFIRYIVYNNNGSASIAELQSILETEYGIRADMSLIRNQVKLSACIFSTITDATYLDDDTYLEAMKNESN